MKMKIIIIMSLILILSVNEQVWANTYTTTKIAANSLISSGGARFLSSIVRGQSGAVAATEAATIRMTGAGAAGILTAIAFTGLSIGVDALWDYLTTEGFSKDPTTGGITQTRLYSVPADSPASNGDYTGDWVNPNNGAAIHEIYHGLYPNKDAAIAALQASLGASANYGVCYSGGLAPVSDVYGVGSLRQDTTGAYSYIRDIWFYVIGSPTMVNQTVTVPVTQQQVTDTITSDLNNGNQKAETALSEQLTRTESALNNPTTDPLAKSSAMPTIQTTLDSGIQDSTKTSLDSKLADPNANSNYLNNTISTQSSTNSTTNYNTTNNTTNSTINNYYQNEGSFTALNQYTGGTTANKDEYQTPEVGDFKGLFQNFLNTMKNTPLFSLPGLLGSSCPSGGNCEFTIDMGSTFGGSRTFSICNWSTGLSAVKAVLLCIASIIAVTVVCKGGA